MLFTILDVICNCPALTAVVKAQRTEHPCGDVGAQAAKSLFSGKMFLEKKGH